MHTDRDAYLTQLKARTGEWPDFEGLIRDIYVAFLKPGDRAIDVGVNEGHHLVNLAEAVGASGKVIGIEAYRPMLWRTLGNVAIHHRHLVDRIEPHNVAVSREAGEATFYWDHSSTGLSSLAKRDVSNGHEVEPTKVNVVTLDSLVSDPVQFIKIDIEGAEYDALCGATRLLESKPLIAFEFDQESPTYFNYQADDFVKLFTSRGYRVTDLFGHPHRSGADLISSQIWNFLAIPARLDVDAVCAPARR